MMTRREIGSVSVAEAEMDRDGKTHRCLRRCGGARLSYRGVKLRWTTVSVCRALRFESIVISRRDRRAMILYRLPFDSAK